MSRRLLHLSKDRKVSPHGIYQASRDRWLPTVHNSFGLPSGESCPGKTPFCTSCYAAISENSQGVAEAMRYNLQLLTQARTVSGMTRLLAHMIARYRMEAQRIGLPPKDRIFRIHWDGDFFSTDYAQAWANVIRDNAGVQFWAYTRSFVPPVDVVPILAGIPNLVLYLSVDEWNAEHARAQVARYPDVLLAYCTIDYKTGRQLAGDRKAIVCPENAERMPLMKDGRGACVDCQLCPKGRSDVLFSTSHREDVSVIGAPTIRRSNAPEAREPVTDACRGCRGAIERTTGPGRPRQYCESCRPSTRREAVSVHG